MNTLICEIDDEKDSIHEYFSFLSEQEQIREGNRLSMTLFITQKSSCFIILYNFVESTTNKIIQSIHSQINSEDISFFDLNEYVRKLIILYYRQVFEKKNRENSTTDIEAFYYYLSHRDSIKLDLKDLMKFYSLYSGNLDAKVIKKTLKKYGISISENNSSLNKVREGRNNLAHGLSSFSEYGRDFSMNQLNALKDETFDFIDVLILNIKGYLNEKKYLERPPAGELDDLV